MNYCAGMGKNEEFYLVLQDPYRVLLFKAFLEKVRDPSEIKCVVNSG